MEHPSFVMSKFLTKEDLYKAKADYYLKRTIELELFLKNVSEQEGAGEDSYAECPFCMGGIQQAIMKLLDT